MFQRSWIRRIAPWLAIVFLLSFIAAGCGSQPAQTPQAQAPAAVDKAAAAKEAAWDALKKIVADNKNKLIIVNGDEVKKMIEGKEDRYYFIDLRKPEDYGKGHVKGAVNIPFGELMQNIEKLPADKTLVLYCYSGQTAGISLVPLKAAGYKVISISKGFPGAQEGKFETDTVAVPFTPAEGKKPADAKAKAAMEGIAEAFDALVKANNNKTLIVEPDQAKGMIDSAPDKYAYIDLRKPEDFANGHIKGAKNVDFNVLADQFGALPKDKTLVLNCYSGQTAGASMVPLQLEGFKFISLSKGYPNAEKSGKFEIEK